MLLPNANGNMVDRDGDTLEWTVFNKPETITGAAATLDFIYGPERERIQRIKTEGAFVR